MGKLKEKLLNNLTSEEIDEINESIKTKYSDSDIQDAITRVSDGTSHTNKVFELFLKELNEGYLSKMGYE